MPIVVDHSGDLPDLEALVTVLTALNQQNAPPEPAPVQQGPTDDILDILRPLTEAGREDARRRITPSTAADDRPRYFNPSSRENRPTYRSQQQPRGKAADKSSDYLSQAFGVEKVKAQMANDNAQLMYRAREAEKLQEDRQLHDVEMQGMQQGDMLSRQHSQDVPEFIQRGILDGSLRYSPDSKRRMTQGYNSIARVRSDPSWSPAQKAALEAKIREDIRIHALNPEPVPFDERPVAPQQQFEQSVVRDPETGEKFFLTTRAGAVHAVPLKPKTDPVALQELRHQHRLEQIQSQGQLRRSGKPTQNRAKQYDAAVKSLMLKHQYDAEPYTPTPEDIQAEMQFRAQFEEAAAESELTPEQQMAAMFGDMGGSPLAAGISPDALHYGPNSQPPPITGEQYSAMQSAVPSQALPTYVPISSPAELQQLNLPSGTPIILPDGRTGVVN